MSYNDTVSIIKKEIEDSDSKVSLAVDVWSHGTKAFFGIMGYFIDKQFDYQERLLGLEPICGSHTGENLAFVLAGVLEQYGIQDSLFAITADNASNNDKMRSELRGILEEKYGQVWSHRAMTVPCMAHVIGLAATEILKCLKVQAQNDTTDIAWDVKNLQKIEEKISLINTLHKVCWHYLLVLPPS